MLLALAIPGVFLWDAWAWFAATEEERASFRDELKRLQSALLDRLRARTHKSAA